MPSSKTPIRLTIENIKKYNRNYANAHQTAEGDFGLHHRIY